MAEKDFIALKWGTLKRWDLKTESVKALLKRYCEIGSSLSAMAQKDTQEQKEIICKMIDECNAETIYLDWDDVNVSKDEAKNYVMNYPKPRRAG